MNRLVKLSIVLLLLMNVGCVKSTQEEIQGGYNQMKSIFDENAFRNFPEVDFSKCDSANFIFPETRQSLGYYGLFITSNFDKISFEKEKLRLWGMKSYELSLNDSCTIGVPINVVLKNDCAPERYIPDIKGHTLAKFNIPESTMIVGFNSGFANHFSQHDSTLKTGEGSFSSGAFIISENTSIIYWLIIW